MLDQAAYVVGDYLLGADQHVDGNRFVGEQPFTSEVGGGAHPGNFGGRAKQRVGHLTGDHVDFVGVGHRDQHVGVFAARLAQHDRVGACAGHRADIQLGVQLAQFCAVGIDDGDVVLLAGKVFGQRCAHLACAKNDDFHG